MNQSVLQYAVEQAEGLADEAVAAGEAHLHLRVVGQRVDRLILLGRSLIFRGIRPPVCRVSR